MLTYQQGAWQQAVRPFYTHCNQWENEVIPIEPYKGHPGHVLIRYTEFGNDSFPVRTKSVPLR